MMDGDQIRQCAWNIVRGVNRYSDGGHIATDHQPCSRPGDTLVIDASGVGLFICDHHLAVLAEAGVTIKEP